MPLIVEENLTSNLETQLRNGVIDVAIIALPFELSGVVTMPLYEEEFMVVVPSDHDWANRQEVDATELADEKVLLLSSGHCFSNQVVQACPSLSRNGEVLQGNSLDTVRNMVASNLGITVLPASATISRYQTPLVKAIPFKKPIPTRKIALAWRKSYGRVQAVDEIAKAIRSLEMFSAGLL
jgi:LysR family hydrogen peroxide-inducible transcriptional activator